jgi:hypothetical protein
MKGYLWKLKLEMGIVKYYLSLIKRYSANNVHQIAVLDSCTHQTHKLISRFIHSKYLTNIF